MLGVAHEGVGATRVVHIMGDGADQQGSNLHRLKDLLGRGGEGRGGEGSVHTLYAFIHLQSSSYNIKLSSIHVCYSSLTQYQHTMY